MTATYVTETVLIDIMGVVQSFEAEFHRMHGENELQYTRNRPWSCKFIAELLRAADSDLPPNVSHEANVNMLRSMNFVDVQINYLMGYAVIELSEAIKAVLPDIELGFTKHVEYQLRGDYDLLIIVSEPLP